MQYRRKPLVIEAVQFTGDNCLEILTFMNRAEEFERLGLLNADIPIIHTNQGTVRCQAGDWIIKSVLGEFYPSDNESFWANYETVE